VVVIWLLQAFGVLGSLHDVRVRWRALERAVNLLACPGGPIKGLYVGYPPKPGPRSLFANGVHGFSVLEADAKELKVRFFDRNLSLLYEYVLRKSIS